MKNSSITTAMSSILPALSLMRIREEEELEAETEIAPPPPFKQLSQSSFAYSFQPPMLQLSHQSLNVLPAVTETTAGGIGSGISAQEPAPTQLSFKTTPLAPIKIPNDLGPLVSSSSQNSPVYKSHYHPHSPVADKLIATTDMGGRILVGSQKLFSLLGVNTDRVSSENLSILQFATDQTLIKQCLDDNRLRLGETESDKVLLCGTITRLQPADGQSSFPVTVWLKYRRDGSLDKASLLWIFDHVAESVVDVVVSSDGIIEAAPNSFNSFNRLFGIEATASIHEIPVQRLIPGFDIRLSNEGRTESRTLSTMEGHRFPADVTTVNVADSAVSIRAFDAISGLIIADEIGRIISYNACFVEKLFGYTDGQVPIGNISDMLPDYAQLRADAAARPSQQCSPSPSDMPYTGGLFIIHKDGSRLPVEIYIRRLHEQSKPLFALWISFTRSIKPFLSSSQAPSSLGRLKAASSVQISDKEPQVVAPGQQTGNRRLSTVSALDRYEILSKIGQGAFGAVYKVAHKSVLKSIYVLKCIKRENLSADFYADDDEFGRVPREIQILNYIRKNGGHPSIVKMTNAFNDPKYFYLEMPMHGNGMDLFDYIDLTPLVSELNVQKIFLQICQAIKYLHGHGIVHRDIKDENIVIDGKLQVQLIDFGSAAWIPASGHEFSAFCGTIDYCPPEILTGNRYIGPPQDIWALGILLYTLTYRENPFYSPDEILTHPIRFPYILSNDLLHLTKRLLQRNVAKRPTINEVLDHVWLLRSNTA